MLKSLRMLPSIIALLAIGAGSLEARADYWPTEFFELVGTSDLIVLGEITAVGDDTFTLKIERTLAGACDAETIEVSKFHDWACAWRWGKYEVGQREIAFLDVEKEASERLKKTIYRPRGAGAEGEFPIVGEHIYPMAIVTLNKHPAEEIGRSSAPKLLLKNVQSAIEGYRTWFALKRGTSKRGKPDAVVEVRELADPPKQAGPFRDRRDKRPQSGDDYARQSAIHRYLVESTREFAAELKQPRIEE